MIRRLLISQLLCIGVFGGSLFAQDLPRILVDQKVMDVHYLPDFSYAGYHHGEKPLPSQDSEAKVLFATDFGVVPNDEKDDSRALLKAMEAVHQMEGPVALQLPKGRIILSEVLYIERSQFVLRGAGSSPGGTVIYCPRPMSYLSDPPALSELREYLVALDKRQREPVNNIDLPYSQYAWSGGMIWIRQPGVRTKAYLAKYDVAPDPLAGLLQGEQGGHVVTVASADQLKVGQVVQIEWYNREGEDGSLLQSIYGDTDLKSLKVGSHHWKYPDHALVRQPTMITAIKGNEVTIKDPLLHDLHKEWTPAMVAWPHLEEVGIEHIRMVFPMAPNIAHHIEEGYNGIYLTRLYNGWVKGVAIENADSGILTEEAANLTIRDIQTSGEKLAHYSVSMSGVHNVLVKGLIVKNEVRHPLSFNTFSTRSVYLDCRVERTPILDQHSGASHQNLFDNIEVYVSLEGEKEYPLFAGGGAGYWKPSHGAYTTFWNLKVRFEDGFDLEGPIALDGMSDGPYARLLGVHANREVTIQYGPNAYVESLNSGITQEPSLYRFQLERRMKIREKRTDK